MAVIFEPKKRYKVKFEGGPYDGTLTLTMSMKKPPKYWGCKTAAEAKGF